jgi:hypothetical protein
MNERIKELAIEARLIASKYSDCTHTTLSPQEQKFAELIVKECIDYCGENLSKTVGGALKIHFGVEE